MISLVYTERRKWLKALIQSFAPLDRRAEVDDWVTWLEMTVGAECAQEQAEREVITSMTSALYEGIKYGNWLWHQAASNRPWR